ncbi:hypothetical protein [Aquibacillus salsiterrae]|uniref:ABC-2 family transporter protein n=1 Tax=Aquibacillus salsiterrae TaxID=2950439 RepID=A0A9X4AG30_9BACI|nr:hypothetical protein [Aquibacillus salsiterrae]MDC3418254.1 hypothetical protein [Aquibacillus salsiterrae]
MKSYLKLVNFEWNRVTRLFAVLLGITFVAQMIGVIVQANKYVKMADQSINVDLMPKAQFLQDFGQIDFVRVVRSVWFMGPIMLCIAGVAFYIFFIWYRDWFGKNTFIYRLLMLPTSRLNIFLAKLTTILLMTFGFVAFQLMILPLENVVFKSMVPAEFRLDFGTREVIRRVPELGLIIPSSIVEFFLYYGAGLMAVSIIFAGILFERSFKWKGIILGAGYATVAVFAFISPLLLQDFVLNGFLYPIELLLLEILAGLIVLGVSIWTSKYLLKQKITV